MAFFGPSTRLISFLYYFFQTNPKIVKRWSNEVQEAVQSRAALVQFHALALLHKVKKYCGGMPEKFWGRGLIQISTYQWKFRLAKQPYIGNYWSFF